jgi:myo-inositol 2-dehydrogenase / D-chiro-inositol 1-dehydrogenase
MSKTQIPLQIVVAGAGRIGLMHAKNIVSRIPTLELVGVVEPKPTDELSSWLTGVDIPLFDTLSDSISATHPEVILISAPTDLHESLVLEASAAGLHVFCEKPVAPDIAAAKRIVDAAARAQVILQIGFNRRFDHNFAAIRQSVKTGGVGSIELVRVTSRDPSPPGIDYVRRSGGLFMDMMIHDIDMTRFLTGDDVTEVFTTAANLVDPAIGEAGDIDTAVVSFRLKSGAIGMIENSRRAAYGYDQRAEIHGSDGSIASRNDTASNVVLQNAVGVHTEKPLYFFIERYEASFLSELTAFAASVHESKPPAVSGADGLEAMRIAAACSLSLREHRPVRLDEIE